MSYSLRSGCHEQTACILDSFSLSNSPTSMDVSGDSAYHTSSPGSSSTSSPTHTNDICSMRNRSSTWASSLRSVLKKAPKSPKKPTQATALLEAHTDTVVLAGSAVTSLPSTETELDAFLSEVWRKDVSDNPRTTTSPVSQYIRKVTELRAFFDQKMAEISQREATYVSELTYFDDTTPLIPASEISSMDEVSMRQMLMETKLGYRFDDLRLKVKKEVAQTVLELRSHYISNAGPRKPRKLRPRATKMLTQWFENHLDHPYPTDAEKQLLAVQSGVTVEQVTTWFSNKRSRSKKMRQLHGRRDRLRTL